MKPGHRSPLCSAVRETVSGHSCSCCVARPGRPQLSGCPSLCEGSEGWRALGPCPALFVVQLPCVCAPRREVCSGAAGGVTRQPRESPARVPQTR